MKSLIVMQECNCCGKRFPIEYYSDGCYGFISETCDCECSFSPIPGRPSISEWLESLKEKDKEAKKMIHAVYYTETYCRTYFVEADDFPEACEKLQSAIEEGVVDGPECCCDSGYKNVTSEYAAEELRRAEI